MVKLFTMGKTGKYISFDETGKVIIGDVVVDPGWYEFERLENYPKNYIAKNCSKLFGYDIYPGIGFTEALGVLEKFGFKCIYTKTELNHSDDNNHKKIIKYYWHPKTNMLAYLESLNIKFDIKYEYESTPGLRVRSLIINIPNVQKDLVLYPEKFHVNDIISTNDFHIVNFDMLRNNINIQDIMYICQTYQINPKEVGKITSPYTQIYWPPGMYQLMTLCKNNLRLQ